MQKIKKVSCVKIVEIENEIYIRYNDNKWSYMKSESRWDDKQIFIKDTSILNKMYKDYIDKKEQVV